MRKIICESVIQNAIEVVGDLNKKKQEVEQGLQSILGEDWQYDMDYAVSYPVKILAERYRQIVGTISDIQNLQVVLPDTERVVEINKALEILEEN